MRSPMRSPKRRSRIPSVKSVLKRRFSRKHSPKSKKEDACIALYTTLRPYYSEAATYCRREKKAGRLRLETLPTGRQFFESIARAKGISIEDAMRYIK